MLIRALRRKPALPPELQELGATLKSAKKSLRSAEKQHSKRVKGIRKELREAEREHERVVRVAQSELDRRTKERGQRIEQAQKRYDSLRATLAPMEIGRFGKSVLYEDRVVTKHGEALLQRGVTALADTAAKIAIARPGAVARLAASGAVNGRAFRSVQGYDARRFYMLIEAPELVALLPCRAGDEESAREFGARVNVAALNARRIERERDETLGDAQHELDAAESHQDAVLAADDALARAVADADAIDLARSRLEDAEGDTEPIEALREQVAALEQEYAQGYGVEEARFAEQQRIEQERRAEEKRHREEALRLEKERRAEEDRLRSEAEQISQEAEQQRALAVAMLATAAAAAADDAQPDAGEQDAAPSEDEPLEEQSAEKPSGAEQVEERSDDTVEPAEEPLRETIVIMETVEASVEARATDGSELLVGGESRPADGSPDDA